MKFLEVGQAFALIYCHPKHKVDALFVHALDDLTEGVLQLTSQFYFEGLASRIIINGRDKAVCEAIGEAYQGYEYWLRILSGYGVPKDCIVLTPESAIFVHGEAREVQKMCYVNSWKSLGIIATPYHVLRCVLTQLANMQKVGTEKLSLHPYTIPINWNGFVERKTVGEATQAKSRLDLLEGEFGKIEKYCQKGDCSSVAELIDFFVKQGC